ncbi:TraM recognition domain-containing protein [Burkholderia cepacia]|uniref:TraM recognition domain-containing protein n=1 Tax=Burkholderia cepacia TaxID=292 RepID=UPI00158BC35A|nr:TraM recognition domain-containing protein [Burkholderia cepacia]
MDINNLKSKIKGIFVLKPIASVFNSKKAYIEASSFVENVSYRHDVPQGDWVPEDLRDTRGSWQLTKDGFPVPSQVLPHEVSIGSESPVLPILNSALMTGFYAAYLLGTAGYFTPVLAILAISYILMKDNFTTTETVFTFTGMACFTFAGAMLTYVLSFFGPAFQNVKDLLLFMPVFYPYLMYTRHRRHRALRLARNGNKYGGAVINSPNSKLNATRELQALNAYRDQKAGIKFITLGIAQGILSFLGNAFAPDKGLPFGLSVKDLTKHLIIFGSTRTGKTTSIIRQLLKELLGMECGLWLLDGKHSLPNEIPTDKVKKIHPDTVEHFNFFQGLEPTRIANIVRNVLLPQTEGDKNEQFNMAAEIMYADILIFRQALIDYKLLPDNYRSQITVKNWYEKQIPVNEEKKPVIQLHPLISKVAENEELLEKMMEDGTVLNATYLRFLEYQNKSGDEKKLYTFTLNSWISPFTQNAKLSKWLDSVNSDVDLNKLKEGAKFSMVMSEDEFGLVGKVVTKLTNNRVYKIIKDRGENWKSIKGQQQVYCVTDECQDIFDKGTCDAIAVLAGFGGTFIASTQNYESLELAVGNLGAQKLFDGFRNFGTFRSSHKTYQVIAQKVGEGKVWNTTAKTSTIAFDTTAKLQLSNAIFDLNNPSRGDMQKAGIQKNMDATDFDGSNIFARALGLQVQGHQTSKEFYSSDGIASFNLSDRAVPYFNEKVIDALNTPFTCFLQVERAEVPRLDVIRANPLLPDFSPLDIEAANLKTKEELGIK